MTFTKRQRLYRAAATAFMIGWFLCIATSVFMSHMAKYYSDFRPDWTYSVNALCLMGIGNFILIPLCVFCMWRVDKNGTPA